MLKEVDNLIANAALFGATMIATDRYRCEHLGPLSGDRKVAPAAI
jgi:hypothetical protein